MGTAALAAAAASPAPAMAAPASPPPTPITLRVGASPLATHPTLAAALDDALQDPTTTAVTLLVEPGTYRERLIIPPAAPPVRVLALLSAADPDGGASLVEIGKRNTASPGLLPPFPAVTLAWETPSPYECVVDVGAPRCALAGFTIAHSSPSVANNFAVLVREGASLALQSCRVTSATGTGLGVEGSASADGCDLSGCASYGVASVGDALTLSRSTLASNRRGGLLTRGLASLTVVGCAITRNGGPGLDLAAGGEATPASAPALGTGCDLSGNAGGPARVGDGWVGGEVAV